MHAKTWFDYAKPFTSLQAHGLPSQTIHKDIKTWFDLPEPQPLQACVWFDCVKPYTSMRSYGLTHLNHNPYIDVYGLTQSNHTHACKSHGLTHPNHNCLSMCMVWPTQTITYLSMCMVWHSQTIHMLKSYSLTYPNHNWRMRNSPIAGWFIVGDGPICYGSSMCPTCGASLCCAFRATGLSHATSGWFPPPSFGWVVFRMPYPIHSNKLMRLGYF